MSEALFGTIQPPETCEVCGRPLDDGRAWQLGLDGAGAHHDCLETVELDEEEAFEGE